ncbi:hypothetical protein [Pelagibacterium limicola]|uniref:hypothetical protein n=1 Tax=Pelagibacterium limicola TaxID=2791022 RepID=UPI0018AF889F|nr:hypothetical protein [Pelagibacterium limicola]
MLIKLEVLEKIKSGEITLQFRRWRKRTVKPGGTLKTKVGVLQIGAITPISAGEVTDADAKRAGFRDVSDFLSWLETMKPGDLDRIEVRYLGPDPREELRSDNALDPTKLSGIVAELAKIDARTKIGWSHAALSLIAERPGVRAEALAGETGLEKPVFKASVRELKALGLTESLETGYRLSPRGEKLLALLKA